MMTYISIISILTRVDPQMPRTSHAAAVERSVAGRRNAPRRPGGGMKTHQHQLVGMNGSIGSDY